MANNKDDYLTYYRKFFEHFAETVNPSDQLPVKLASYKLVNLEIVGGIIDWTSQYLTQKNCPPCLISPLIKIVIDEIRKSCKKDPLQCGFNPADDAYEPLRLMQTVMAKVNEVCLRYMDNSRLCSLPQPGAPFNAVSVYAIKNSRRRMEDRHVVIHDLNTMFNIQEASPSSYYAIFDGHAGHDAAAYSAAHLHQYLAESQHFVSNPEQALRDAFCKTDALFIDKCKVENFSSGTTAVCALLKPKEKTLYVAWVGDSQALICKQGHIMQCVEPHKPNRQDEKERIEKQGGCVIFWGIWRVNGQLAVSRAIGDSEYKPFVIAIPDVREIPLDGGEDFLILACDGLWDFVSEEEAAQTVYNMLHDNPDDTDRISQRLVQLSKEQGSCDNISVIVVFLREPHKIAGEPLWGSLKQVMDASLENANNPFANSNGNTNETILTQKTEGLLLNLTDNFKQNGEELSPNTDFFKALDNSNYKRSEFDETDDLGPETDVDAVDDVLLSPSIAAAKALADGVVNNNDFNPFSQEIEKAAYETDLHIQKQEVDDFDERRSAREETPTPPADAVHDVGGLVENAADSGEESEDEWNYIKGEEANKENINPDRPSSQVAEISEEPEDDSMSQLNPNAAEFIPVSPTQVGSPVCMFLKEEDKVLAQSPKRPPPQEEVDINVPNPVEFEDEVKSKPSEVDEFDDDPQKQDGVLSSPIESLLNGKNIDDIPEFQPGSTPTKDLAASEEFHFGPKAAPAPFTPAKLLDHSENISTRAVFGDDTVTTLNDSCFSAHDNTDLACPLREQDPMSMSFHQDRDDPFGLNKVQELPADVDKFIESVDDSKLDDTISDLPEHEPLGAGQQENVQITDLDKDEELDLEEKVDLPKEETDLDNKDVELLKDFEVSKSPELACEYQKVPEESENITPTLSKGDIQAASPEPYPSKESESISPEPICDTPKSFEESKSPEPICDISSTQTPEPFGVEQVCDMPTNEVSDLVCQAPKSPEPIVSPQPENIQEEVTSSQIEDFCKFGSQPDVNIINEVEDQIKFVENKSDELVSEEGSAVACDSNVLNNLESPIPPVRETIPGEAEVLTDDDRHYLNIASPTEEVTSSIKDELSSPRIESPPAEYPIELEHPVESAEAAAEQVEHIIESTEHPVESTQHPVESAQCPIQPAEHPIAENLNFAQELSLATTEKEIVPEETSSPVFDQRIPDTCPISTPKSINERESVTTAEVNSFLDRSLLPDIESPLSPSNNTIQPQEDSKEPNLGETQYDITDPSHPLSKCVYPLPPEVESIQEVVDEKPQPSAPLLEELPKEPVPEQDESFISKETVGAVSQLVEPSISKEETTGEVAATEATSGVAAAAGVAAAGAAVAAAALTADKKAKPKTATAKKTLSKPSSPTKTPILKTSTPKTTPSRPSTGSKPPTKPLSKPPATTKPPASTTTLKANATKTAATRPKPSASTLLKSTDKKPMTNGEHKPLSSVKKTDSSLLSARSGTVSKTSLQPPKSTTKMSSNTSVGKTNGPSKLTSAPTAKPRPTTLSSARTNNVTKAASQTAPTSAKTNPSKSSSGTFPKTNTTTASKPKTTSAAAPKARVPLTRTVVSKTASPDVEKQTKESANKLTASRTATTTSRTGSASARTTTTLKKTEVKMNSTRSTTLASKSSTTSVTKSTTAGKKSTETASKTKVTKMEKPKENGISTVVTEQITLVNNAINETNGVGEEPHLIKDNSPIDNKLIVDTLIETNTAD